jgi:hypothetical protein
MATAADRVKRRNLRCHVILQDGVVQQTVTGVQGPPLVQMITSMTDPAGKGSAL